MILHRTLASHRLPILACLLMLCCLLGALQTTAQQSSARITQSIDESNLVRLAGSVHPLARAEFDRGAAADSLPLHRMVLLLGRSAEQETALRALLDEQQNSGSPNYHKWLTPEQFGQQFGAAQADVDTVVNWLTVHGFTVNRVSPSRSYIEFDGTAGQLREAFHTQLHQYAVNGRQNWANAADPQIPAALAPVVRGFASLNNFPRKHYSHITGTFSRDVQNGKIIPDLTTTGGMYGLGPGDFATIYNSLPLLQTAPTSIDGAGQTIAIVGETNIDPNDVANFRSLFGLNTGSGSFQVVLDGPDPGINGDEVEAVLDSEWSSAVAPGAAVKLVVSSTTEVSAGIDLSALYIIESNMAGVMSVSYGECESFLTAGGNSFYNALWEQAAAQGITVAVSSGDDGSAACDNPNKVYRATHGLAVNGIGSTPFNVSVGGTDYYDAGNFSTYWKAINAPVTAGPYSLAYTSALSYIPEMTWNESCANNAPPTTACVGKTNGAFGGLTLWAGSGGRSSCASGSGGTCAGYAKPTWQSLVDIGHTVRVIPDVSFFAAGGGTSSNSFFVLCETDQLQTPGETACVNSGGTVHFVGVGGTSASTPAFAGVVALALQKIGGTNPRLGNLNYLLYPISVGTPSAFNDVTRGNISVPCAAAANTNCSVTSGSNPGVLVDSGGINPAYPAVTGYDLATGLGTPNITSLVNALAMATSLRTASTTTLSLNSIIATVRSASTTVTPPTVTGVHGGPPITVAVDVTNASETGPGPSGDVAILSSTGVAIDSTGPFSGTLTSSSTRPTGGGLIVVGSGHSTASWNSALFPGGIYNAYASYSGDSTNAPSISGNIAINISAETSKVWAILETFDNNGYPLAFYTTTASIIYGTPYIMRYDVTDITGALSGTYPYITSTCILGTASCPTGILTVTNNSSPLDGGSFTLNPNGTAEDLFVNLPGGTDVVAVSYPGDPSYSTNTASITVTVAPAATSIPLAPTANPTSPSVGQSVQLAATVTTTSNGLPPIGTVTFYDGATPMTGTYSLTGVPASTSAGASANATLTTSFSTQGSHSVTAKYVGTGDPNYSASTASPTLTVSVSAAVLPTPTITTPTSSANPVLAGTSVTLTTTVSPGGGGTAAPTGAVTFFDGSTSLGTASLNTVGTTVTATLSHTFTSAGTHSITASVAADSNYSTATSSALSLTVNAPVTPAMGQTTISVTGANSGSNTLTLTPAASFPGGPVTVSCSANSGAASCSAATSPVTVPAGGGGTATDTINYSVPALAANHVPQHVAPWKSLGGIVMAGFFLLALPGVRRRSRWLLTLLLMAGALAAVSCSGGGSTPPSPVTYTFTVSATYSGAISTTSFTVTVH